MVATSTGAVGALAGLLEALPDGALVQLHGPPAAGKTSLALTVARERSPACLVLPEQPLPERMGAVLGPAAEETLVARPTGFDEQAAAVERGCQLLADGRTTCLVLDSLTYLYRFERLSATDALQALFDQVRRMRQAARAGDGLAVFTNQVRGGPDGWTALGGPALAHASDVIVELSPLEGDWRVARLETHPSRPAGAVWELELTDTGVS